MNLRINQLKNQTIFGKKIDHVQNKVRLNFRHTIQTIFLILGEFITNKLNFRKK